MLIDFKVTSWERFEVAKEEKEEALKLLKNGTIQSSEDLLDNIKGVYLRDIDGLTTEQMTVDDNDGQPTIEVLDGKLTIYANNEEEKEEEEDNSIYNLKTLFPLIKIIDELLAPVLYYEKSNGGYAEVLITGYDEDFIDLELKFGIQAVGDQGSDHSEDYQVDRSTMKLTK